MNSVAVCANEWDWQPGGLFLQGEMHALVAAVLLGMGLQFNREGAYVSGASAPQCQSTIDPDPLA